MKLPIRLENAITKLYTAFHSGQLKASDCKTCAVGNICNNNYDWNNAVRTMVSKYGVASRHIDINFINETIIKSGYSVKELAEIELRFITEALFKTGTETKETQFKGLCAVVEYLCELDNIPNVMDYTNFLNQKITNLNINYHEFRRSNKI